MIQPETVRVANEADIPAIYWLLLCDLEADNSLGLPVSPKAVLEKVRAACTLDGGCAGVIDGPDGIIGSIGLFASLPWFSDQVIVSQMWMFVEPTARKGTHYGEDLQQFALWHRSDMSSKLGYSVVLQNAVMSRKRLAAKLRFWGRYGEMIGATFWDRGEHDGQQRPNGHAKESPAAGRDERLQRPRP